MSEYITPAEATKIRVHHEGGGAWAIDAADDAGRYTDSNWNRDGSHDKKMTRERAIELVPEFVAHLGLPAGLPIEVRECDPPRVVEVIRQNVPARIACRDDEFIEPSEATKIRVFQEGSFWEIDAADDSDRCTEHHWTHDGGPDIRLTRERAIELVPEFVAHLGLPAGLPIEVRECDPPRVVEVIR
jgi:hypothetical protein